LDFGLDLRADPGIAWAGLGIAGASPSDPGTGPGLPGTGPRDPQKVSGLLDRAGPVDPEAAPRRLS